VTSSLTNLNSTDLSHEFFNIRKKLLGLQQIYHSCSKKLAVLGRKDNRVVSEFRSDVDIKISTLRKQSIFIVFRQAQMLGYRSVDLHGLTVDEAQELVILIIDQIIRIMCTNNTKR
jgi:hypothetical protein